jgi:hypothetical protein
MTYAHETSERGSKETKNLLLLRWERDQSKESGEKEDKETTEEA